MTLHEIAAKYGTDKLQHGYIDFYARTLPKNPKKILEIGVKEGASIRMWKEYFPDAEIHGLDLFEEYPIPDIEGVTFHKGNQCDHMLLERLRQEEFDVIIDDGSHNARDQMVTFFSLFNGGHYYIEDLHCNDEEFYSQGLDIYLRPKYLLRRLRDQNCSLNINQSKNIILVKC